MILEYSNFASTHLKDGNHLVQCQVNNATETVKTNF